MRTLVPFAVPLLLALAVACDKSEEPAPAAAEAFPLQTAIGDRLPTRWIGGPPGVLAQGAQAPPATLIRFWTDTCPYCAASLPALEALRAEFAERGLEVVGIYHPKPPRPVSDEEVVSRAERLGFHGPLGVDADWSALRRIWLDSAPRAATSASFLLDARGIVRFIHPGPQLFPSSDPRYAREDEDYQSLRSAIEELLAGH